MNVLDIIGPVMVGPSSSHTAGAVRIGLLARRLLGEPVVYANIGLYGSFLATGHGHGTDRAIVAGLLGMKVDDMRIPDSFALAEEAGMRFELTEAELMEAHPNTAFLKLRGSSGRELEILAASVGGGRVKICEIDGLTANFYGDYPTLVVLNRDKPGLISGVTAILASEGINIATLQLYRDSRQGKAVSVYECDQEISEECRKCLELCPGVVKLTYLSPEE